MWIWEVGNQITLPFSRTTLTLLSPKLSPASSSRRRRRAKASRSRDFTDRPVAAGRRRALKGRLLFADFVPYSPEMG